MKKKGFFMSIVFVLMTIQTSYAYQELTYNEFITYVKTHHPLVKQANLQTEMGTATILKAKGNFDPKLTAAYDRKKFKKTTYYDELNTTLKIPTWYGVELKANFEKNEGVFLDPSLTVPDDGLYSAGISIPIAQGLLINERMAMLKKAHLYQKETRAKRELLINKALYKASIAYFKWLEFSRAYKIQNEFLKKATERTEAIKRSVAQGEKPLIDITEATIAIQDRALKLEVIALKMNKARLHLNTFLWLDDVPMELQESVLPVFPEKDVLQKTIFNNNEITAEAIIDQHPKLMEIDTKIGALKIDKRLKINKLLPKIFIEYNFLTPKYDQTSSLNTANYKTGINMSFPLFLRKERGNIKLAKLKIEAAKFDRLSNSLAIENKIKALKNEIKSIDTQNELITDIARKRLKLVTVEERKFSLGESSLFLINSREQKLIAAQEKENVLQIKKLVVLANLYHTIGKVNF